MGTTLSCMFSASLTTCDFSRSRKRHVKKHNAKVPSRSKHIPSCNLLKKSRNIGWSWLVGWLSGWLVGSPFDIPFHLNPPPSSPLRVLAHRSRAVLRDKRLEDMLRTAKAKHIDLRRLTNVKLQGGPQIHHNPTYRL